MRIGLRVLGHADLDGQGDGMQVMHRGDYVFVGRMQPGRPLLVVDVSRPSRPEVVARLPAYPDTWTTKCQVHGDLMLVNYEQRGRLNPDGRAGFAMYDIRDPAHPREVYYHPTGGRGIHRIWWAGERYAYMSGAPAGFRSQILMIFDLASLPRVEEVGRWWLPGMAEGESPTWPGDLDVRLHHGVYHDGRLYCGLWDGGCAILDVRDPGDVKMLGRLAWAPGEGSCTHTALPLPSRGLLAVLDEATQLPGLEPPKYLRILAMDQPSALRELSRWQAEDEGYSAKAGRFGPHNLHENRPDTYQSETLLFVTYFSAGLRVVDVSRPEAPTEVARFVPPDPPGGVIQSNDVLVTRDGLIFLTDRGTAGLYVLELT